MHQNLFVDAFVDQMNAYIFIDKSNYLKLVLSRTPELVVILVQRTDITANKAVYHFKQVTAIPPGLSAVHHF